MHIIRLELAKLEDCAEINWNSSAYIIRWLVSKRIRNEMFKGLPLWEESAPYHQHDYAGLGSDIAVSTPIKINIMLTIWMLSIFSPKNR